MQSRALDQAARNMGFKDYATYQAYQARQQAMRLDNGLNGTGHAAGRVGVPQAAPQQPQNNILQSIPIHPSAILDYINRKLGNALGN